MAKATPNQATRLSPGRRKIEILEVARVLLSEVGHENFLPLEVARRCGVSEGTIYRYFPTKRDLLLKVTEEWLEELLAAAPEPADQQDIAARLKAAVTQALQIVLREPELTRYVFLSERADPEYRRTRLYRLVGRFTSNINGIIEEAVERGIFRTDVPIAFVRNMIFGAIEHQTWLYLRGESNAAVDNVTAQAADNIAGIIFRGMSAAAPVNTELVEQSEARLRAAAEVLSQEVELLVKAVR